MVVVTLTACNSTTNVTNADVCTNDWGDIGYKTAISGKSVRYFNKFEEQCGDKLTNDAKSNYLDGFTSGIKEFCTYENGHKLGSKSLPNKNTCPFELKEEFEKGYNVAAVAQKKQKALVKRMQDELKFYENTRTKKSAN
jgi:hypothetical protein